MAAVVAALVSGSASGATAPGIRVSVSLPKPGKVTVVRLVTGVDQTGGGVRPSSLAVEVGNASGLPVPTLVFASVGKGTGARHSVRFSVTLAVGRLGTDESGARRLDMRLVPIEGPGPQSAVVLDTSQNLFEAPVYLPSSKAKSLLRSLKRAGFKSKAYFRLVGSASDQAYARALTFAASDLPLPDGAVSASPAGVSQRGAVAGVATRSQGGTEAVVWIDRAPIVLAPPVGAGSCEATDAGDDGVVVGNCELSDSTEAVMWRGNGQSFTVDRTWPGFRIARIDGADEGAGASADGRAAILMGDHWGIFGVPSPSEATSISDAGGSSPGVPGRARSSSRRQGESR